MDEYADQAAEIQEQHPDIALGRLLKGHTNSKLLQHLLVRLALCVAGAPDRLYDRTGDVTQRPPGSTITFLKRGIDVFTELMIGGSEAADSEATACTKCKHLIRKSSSGTSRGTRAALCAVPYYQ